MFQASPRQLHGPDLPPCGQNLRLAEGEEKKALLVVVAVPAIHDLAVAPRVTAVTAAKIT
jgi:hypothetical protein